jgi:LuxR family maltose regulon positive regulatory protein
MIDESKLEIPPARQGIVGRARLLARLDDAPDTRVVTVLGPPGSGKTSLLAQHSRACRDRVAWVSLEDGDNDSVQLLRYVTQAVERLRSLDDPISESLASPGASALEVLPRFTNSLRRQGRAVTLVLDNAHLLWNVRALDIVALLVDRLPEGSRVLLGAREAPSLPLSRWRGSGTLVEVTGTDLALDVPEARATLAELGLELTSQQVEQVVAVTEGWAVAIYLVSRSIRERGTGPELPAIRGHDAFLSAYLRETLLDRLDDADLEFMTRSSVLERLTGPLCDAVTGMEGSAARLEALTRHNLLILPIAESIDAYRYHSVLRDVLLHRLDQQGPGLAAAVHGAAARWMEAHGDAGGAVHHSMEAHDLTAVRRLIALHALATYRQGGHETVARWFGYLGDDDVAADPILSALAGWLAIMSGEADEAEHWADAVEAQPAPARGLADRTEARRSLLRAALCRNGVVSMLADADRAMALEPPDSPWLPVSIVMAGVARSLSGLHDDALALYRQLDLMSPAHGAGAQNMARAELALDAIERRQWDEAEALVRRSRQSAQEAGVEQYITSLLGLVAAARLAIRHGTPDVARELVVKAQNARPRLSRALPHWSVRCLTELARVQLLIADLAGAAASLAQAEEVLAARPDLGWLGEAVRDLRAKVARSATRSTSGALTPAELRLLPYLSTYLSFKEIATRLGLSHNTIKTETMGLYAKLDVTTRADAVERAVDLGLLEPIELPAPIAAVGTADVGDAQAHVA